MKVEHVLWLLVHDPESILVRGLLVVAAFLLLAALLAPWVKLSLHVAFVALTATALSLLGSAVGYARPSSLLVADCAGASSPSRVDGRPGARRPHWGYPGPVLARPGLKPSSVVRHQASLEPVSLARASRGHRRLERFAKLDSFGKTMTVQDV